MRTIPWLVLLGACLSACGSMGSVTGTCDPATSPCETCDPSGAEICDGVDNDCDGGVDNVADPRVDCEAQWPAASDVGTWSCAEGACTITSCAAGLTDLDAVLDNGCEASCVPTGVEVCDPSSTDEDCDGSADDAGASGCLTFLADADGDGFGVDGDSQCLCRAAGAYSADVGGDCDDGIAAVRPGVSESVADGVDQNCDGAELCFVDADDDGTRPDAASMVTSPNLSCADPGEAVGTDPTGDCDDSQAGVSPAAVEIAGDEFDQNCDGEELCFVDGDGDGHRADGGGTVVSSDLSCAGSGEAAAATPDDDCDDSASTCVDDCGADADTDLVPDCRDGCRDIDSDTLGGTWYGGVCVGTSCSAACAGGSDDCDDEASTCMADCTTDTDSDTTPDCRDGCRDVDNDSFGGAWYVGACVGAACSPVCTGGSNDCDDEASTCVADCATNSDTDLTPDCRDGCHDDDGDTFGGAWYAGTCVGANCGALCAGGGSDCNDQASTCTTDCTTQSDGDGIADCRDGCRDVDGDGYGGAWYSGTCTGTACSAACATGTSDCNDNASTCVANCALDADVDGVSDCRDRCVDNDGDTFGGAGYGGTCAGTACTAACAGGTSDCDNNASTCIANCIDDTDEDGVADCRDGCLEIDLDSRGPSGITGTCVGSACVAVCAGGTADCDPYSSSLYQLIVGYADADFDGHGAGAAIPVCSGQALAVGFSALSDDCDDGNALRAPNSADIPGDGLDGDCVLPDVALDESTAVYADVNCVGACNAGTRAVPHASLATAIAQAEASLPTKVVVLAQGSYDGLGTGFATSVSLLGGYEATGWTRNPSLYTTTIQSSAPVTLNLGVISASVGLALDGLTIRSPSGSTTTTVAHSGSTVPVLVIQDCIVEGPNSASGHALSMSAGGRLIANRTRFTSGSAAGGSTGGIFARSIPPQGLTILLDEVTIDAAAGSSATRYALSVNNLSPLGSTALAIVDSDLEGGAATTASYGLLGPVSGGPVWARAVRSTFDGGSGAVTTVGVQGQRLHLVVIDSVLSGGVPTAGPFAHALGLQLTSSSSLLAVNSRFEGVRSAVGQANGTGASVTGGARALHSVFDGGLGGATTRGLALGSFGLSTVINNVLQGGSGLTATSLETSLVRLVLLNNTLVGSTCPILSDFFECITAFNGPTAPAINVCDWGSCVAASGNVALDPQLGADGVHRTGSNVRDMGVAPGVYYSGGLDDLDVDGQARPQGVAPDIGPDEAP